MSADNWTSCPCCKIRHPDGGELDTLREDYTQGIDSYGFYVVEYSCKCQSCGASWKFNATITPEWRYDRPA